MIEALSFLGLHGPVTRDEQSCICYDSMHAAGICLVTIQARTYVQLALACQRFMIFVQRKLRLTMQHVYGHSGNLGNECAGHAAALGTLGFTSSQIVTTRWIHHDFEASVCFDGRNKNQRSLGTIAAHSNKCNVTSSRKELALVFLIGSTVPLVHFT